MNIFKSFKSLITVWCVSYFSGTYGICVFHSYCVCVRALRALMRFESVLYGCLVLTVIYHRLSDLCHQFPTYRTFLFFSVCGIFREVEKIMDSWIRLIKTHGFMDQKWRFCIIQQQQKNCWNSNAIGLD